MKKTLALLLALAMMLSVLAGCAKDPASDPADPTPSTPADPTPSTPSDPTPTPTPDPVVKTEPYGTFRDYTTTEITNIKYIDRGYDHIEDKLIAIGADIRRVPVEEKEEEPQLKLDFLV